MRKHPKPEQGIEVRHTARCRSRESGRCSCEPGYRGHIWSARDQKRIRGPWFPTVAQARNWRQDALVAVRTGRLRAPVALTVGEAADDFIEGARDGRILDRAGTCYKPSSIRNYDGWLRRYVLPAFGDRRLGEVRRADVQDLVDALIGRGLQGSTVRNALDPLRRIYDRALKRDVVAIDPTDGIDWPATSRKRDRVAAPGEARALIAALPVEDRALWATAMYAGLRAGELRALRVSAVDLAAGVIHVVAGWDDVEGEIATKSDSGCRVVPIIAELRPLLLASLIATGRRGKPDALVFGRTDAEPFLRSTPRSRARKAWKAAGLNPITMHECRHTYASTMVAAGIDPGEVMRRMGHSTIAMTLDRYTHGIKGNEADTAAKLQAFIDLSRGTVVGQSRAAGSGPERS
jgi:integrase